MIQSRAPEKFSTSLLGIILVQSRTPQIKGPIKDPSNQGYNQDPLKSRVQSRSPQIEGPIKIPSNQGSNQDPLKSRVQSRSPQIKCPIKGPWNQGSYQGPLESRVQSRVPDIKGSIKSPWNQGSNQELHKWMVQSRTPEIKGPIKSPWKFFNIYPRYRIIVVQSREKPWTSLSHKSPFTSKLNSKTVLVLPSLDRFIILPFHLSPSPVHPTRFSFCFFPGFLAIFILLSSNNNNRKRGSVVLFLFLLLFDDNKIQMAKK